MATGEQTQGGGYRLDWLGDVVYEDAMRLLSEAWGQVGLAVEGEAKKELYKGHGVVTGTLRRSIHTAKPGYSWSGDNVEPTPNTPERGGKQVVAENNGTEVRLEVGSGMNYAAAIEFGFSVAVEYAMKGIKNFEGYRYMRIGLDKVKPRIPDILSSYFERVFKDKA